MSITPADIIIDLENYIDLFGIKLSKEAKKTFEDIEEFSFRCNYPCNYILFFSKTIRNMKELQRLFYSKEINPNLAALILEIRFYDLIDTATDYQKGSKPYSYIHNRSSHDKTAILDKAMQYCVKEDRSILENKDIILSAIDFFENYIIENKKVDIDCSMRRENINLEYVCGQKNEDLLITFDEIREMLNNNALTIIFNRSQ
jgi:hypothetical protein